MLNDRELVIELIRSSLPTYLRDHTNFRWDSERLSILPIPVDNNFMVVDIGVGTFRLRYQDTILYLYPASVYNADDDGPESSEPNAFYVADPQFQKKFWRQLRKNDFTLRYPVFIRAMIYLDSCKRLIDFLATVVDMYDAYQSDRNAE